METIVSHAPNAVDVRILRIEGNASDCSPDVGRLEPLLESLLATNLRYLVVDLAGLTGVGCVALSKLMCAVIMLRGMGGDMVLAAADEQTLETLRTYGVDRMVHTYASVNAAVVAVQGPISVGDAERL